MQYNAITHGVLTSVCCVRTETYKSDLYYKQLKCALSIPLPTSKRWKNISVEFDLIIRCGQSQVNMGDKYFWTCYTHYTFTKQCRTHIQPVGNIRTNIKNKIFSVICRKSCLVSTCLIQRFYEEMAVKL
jgi:hypothetical protein